MLLFLFYLCYNYKKIPKNHIFFAFFLIFLMIFSVFFENFKFFIIIKVKNMLELKEIKKEYKVGNGKVEALKGISLQFRESEFVSILGQSGCGKTTLLNIIGGLDHSTSGDLIVDGVSTKNYTDRDWDSYRNHRIGFIFQSYNLIPHQTILENVELSLTISGVGKAERVKRAKEALDKVGLKGEYNKKPNQLSGGQCQRVAIARALVNEPEILLADEPTGALDSETSVQIMELIKEIAKECLVIMVTHNPDLAEKYSTRIIRLLDGKVISDSNPFEANEKKQKEKKEKKNKKSKLSFWTAFKLSAKNLYSKFKRTFMVCLAGSIGIIGVATVLAISSGVSSYIQSMQNDMLSGNPITVSETGYDLSSFLSSMSTSAQKEVLEEATKDGYINVDYFVEQLVSMGDGMNSLLLENDITQDYVDFVYQMPEEYYAEIVSYYGLDLSNNLYTTFKFEGQENNNMSLAVAIEIYTSMLQKTEYKDYAQYISLFTESFMQAPDSEEFILSQYDIVSDANESKIAQNANEIMLVLDEDNALTDLLLAQLGYYSQEEFFNIVYKATGDEKYDESLDKDHFSYDELLGKTFTWYPNDTIFTKTETENNPFVYSAYENASWENGIELKITAILKPKESVSYGALESGLYYTSALAKEIIKENISSQTVLYLLERELESFDGYSISGTKTGITYDYQYFVDGTAYNDVGILGEKSSIMGSSSTVTRYTLSLRSLGGKNIPNEIAIYPTDFNQKDNVTKYLDQWNSDEDIVVGDRVITKEERTEINYTDNLALVISIVNNMINIVTIALVAFSALSLVVSTVMIAIITYVSVMERVKEIGVIRSLGGRKRDVSSLFIAETFIIGGISGVFGVVITYILSLIINAIVGSLVGIFTIASLPILTAFIMILISIVLTLISGLIPAVLAAKKDPVEALRSE